MSKFEEVGRKERPREFSRERERERERCVRTAKSGSRELQ
jgi:hypothetical protein